VWRIARLRPVVEQPTWLEELEKLEKLEKLSVVQRIP
jgi:hypothetical protein